MKFRSLVRFRKKLKGTTELLRQALSIIALTAVIGLLIIFLIDYAYGFIIFGVSLFSFGGVVISFRRIIWDEYVQTYRLEKKGSNFLTKPTKFAYWLNIALIWPLAMIIGLVAIVVGVTFR